jgi:serine phosphatase RsbU (regulator of sigma subunit)
MLVGVSRNLDSVRQARGAPPAADPEQRLAALHRTALLDAPRESGLDALTRAVHLAIGVPTSLLSLVDVDRQFFISSQGLAPEWETRRETPLTHSFCRLAVERDEELVIDDARSDPRVHGNRAIDELGVIAYAGVPLHTVDGYAIGTLCAIDSVPRSWTEEELALLRALADAAAALINALTDARTTREARELVEAQIAATRRVERELDEMRVRSAAEFEALALSFQRGLLPRGTLYADDLRVTSVYLPGEQRMLLGGDFVDTFAHADGTISMLIGDVAGHGSEAAALGVGLRTAWRALVLTASEPGAELLALNELARAERDDPEMFATVCACSISPSRSELVWSSAGHPPPILIGSEIREAAGRIGPPLAVSPSSSWELNRTPLEPGMSVLLYTDGVIEGRREPRSSDRFDVEGLLAAIAAVPAGPPSEQKLHAIVEAATRANGGPLADDVALLAATLTTP